MSGPAVARAAVKALCEALAEAHEALGRTIAEVEQARAEADDAGAERNRAVEERDFAIRQSERLQDALAGTEGQRDAALRGKDEQSAHADTNHDMWAIACDEAKALRAERDRAEAERDQAREQRDGMARLLSEVQAERDEARAMAKDVQGRLAVLRNERGHAIVQRDLARAANVDDGLLEWLPPADVPEPDGPCAVVLAVPDREGLRIASSHLSGFEDVAARWYTTGTDVPWGWASLTEDASLVAVIRPPDPEPEAVTDGPCAGCDDAACECAL